MCDIISAFVFRTPALVSAETLYKNDGTNFDDNWQERAIERWAVMEIS